jgi:hypothetical protein
MNEINILYEIFSEYSLTISRKYKDIQLISERFVLINGFLSKLLPISTLYWGNLREIRFI